MMEKHPKTMRRWTAGKLIGWMGLAVLTMSLFAAPSWAADMVKIESLLASPESYKMKLVRVEGVVVGHRIGHFIGSTSKLEKCIQRFMMKDETGVIEAVYTTLCPIGATFLRNGDRVTLEAHFSGILDVRSVTKR
jgi:hypothetical protein